MEKLTLKPHANEIVVNHGTTDGMVDIFSYSPDDTATRGLGSLYVIGHRETDASNVGYVVSLISALARREYYANPSQSPREAFSRTLHKANEVVDEFFRNGDVKLSVGIVAISGSTIMVSKLDKFKILLAREKQVIDILDNVLLFSKELSQKRRFSSIIHGSVLSGDRILAFVPTRAITSREKNLKSLFLKLPQGEFAAHVASLGEEHATFAAALLHIDIAQTSEPALIPSPQPPELMQSEPLPAPSLASSEPQSDRGTLVWKPRQWGSPLDAMEPLPASVSPALVTQSLESEEVQPVTLDAEMPHIIPSEFSRGTRRTLFSRLATRIRFVRLDGRGKAISLALVTLLAVGSILGAKSFFIVSPQSQKEKQALTAIQGDLERARSKAGQNDHVGARQILSQALSALLDLDPTDSSVKDLHASLSSVLDDVDNAQNVTPSLIVSSQPHELPFSVAAWSSASQTTWVGGSPEDGTSWAAPVRDGSSGTHLALGSAKIDLLLGWRNSVLALNFSNHSIVRTVGDSTKTYSIPTQNTILDAAEFADSLYILTDKSILKISDLDTDKPVTKVWLTDTAQLAADSSRIWVDGSVMTMGRDGLLTTYYKGTKTNQIAVPLTPTGTWRLVGSADGLLAIAQGDARRIYLIDPLDGSLVRTLKIDSQLPYIYLSAGPDASVLLVTAEGKVWQAK